MALYHAVFIFLKGVNFAGHLNCDLATVCFYLPKICKIDSERWYVSTLWPAHEISSKYTMVRTKDDDD